MQITLKSVLKNSGIAFGILGIATAFCFPVQRISGSDTHVPLLFVLAVLFVSRFTDGYVYGIVASIIAVFGVNYVFTFPYFKLNFAITGYPLTFVAMLAVACSVSALTTQIKKQEQMRLEVEREKMRANLLRAVSHDIRTPLTSIVGSASGIIDNYDALSKENILELLGDMKSEGQWLSAWWKICSRSRGSGMEPQGSIRKRSWWRKSSAVLLRNSGNGSRISR